LAFEAAMTGHQVWATLHAVDALTIVSRLKDIGVDEFKLYDPAVFTGLVGQRLTRALCDGCKIPLMQARDEGMVDDDLWERTLSVYSRDIEGIYVEGKGCPKCNGTGVVGRSVVAEVLLPDDAFMEYMKREDKLAARRHWVENLNGITMMGHGILKAKAGVCSTYEIERMLGPLELDRDRVRKVAAE
ncbi:MAG: ATPase, T2SS/T4P/T4SS family, partial [Pseudomonadota bacterium]